MFGLYSKMSSHPNDILYSHFSPLVQDPIQNLALHGQVFLLSCNLPQPFFVFHGIGIFEVWGPFIS